MLSRSLFADDSLTVFLNILLYISIIYKTDFESFPDEHLEGGKIHQENLSRRLFLATLRTAAKKSAALVAAAIVAASIPVDAAFARDVQPYAGLTPCKKNAAFKKNNKKEVKGLEKRMKKYDPEIRAGVGVASDHRQD